MLKYLQVKNQVGDSADIHFYGDIVGSEWSKWDDTDKAPEDVLQALDEAKNASKLNIYINSAGGSVFAGLAMYNMLKRHQAHKTVYVDGVAGSIASIIAMAGDVINIPSNAFLMIHKPWNILQGNASDFRKMADDLDRIETGMLSVYQSKLAYGTTTEDIKTMLEAETWLDGKEAAKYFNVTVSDEVRYAASISDLSKYAKAPKALTAREPDNSKELEALRLQYELLTI
ncbi:Clp protease ClpP [Paenibacillus sp. PFR10]|uniref:ATP-dependent Clp protease proteolytic subunit n=1 Tax=Paenibacillus violae TaxID=3077234 RepID=A0ABU3R7A6_9BACL|nr:head maturation protease, ClpP-related [Paenibacillus sp. PFR10]MDU0200158.1 Clp protease ClpP [Paenibacillus sp. PFR10]